MPTLYLPPGWLNSWDYFVFRKLKTPLLWSPLSLRVPQCACTFSVCACKQVCVCACACVCVCLTVLIRLGIILLLFLHVQFVADRCLKGCYIIKECFLFYFNHTSLIIFYHSVWLGFEIFGLRVQVCCQLVQFTLVRKGYDNHHCHNKP